MRTPALRVLALLMLPGLASAANFTGIGDLPGGDVYSTVFGISADGTTVTGYSTGQTTGGIYGPQPEDIAYRWTAATGMIALEPMLGHPVRSNSTGASSDGSVIVGGAILGVGSEAYRWTASTGMVGVGDLPGGKYASWANDISADGTVIAGSSMGALTTGLQEAFRWTPASGMVSLGVLPGDGGSEALAVSDDGTVVVGWSLLTAPETFTATRWTASSGMVSLGYLPGGSTRFSVSKDVSADGMVVVGTSSSALGSREAFRWTQATGMVGLGDISGGVFVSVAEGVSADGSVIVGSGEGPEGIDAFIWTADHGMQRLFDVLVEQGVGNLAGWSLFSASGISADGTTIAGFGRNPSGMLEGWVAQISPVPIPAAVWLFGSAIGLIGVMRRKVECRSLADAHQRARDVS